MINENNIKTLGTHSGKFHADDVMATAILRLLLGDIKVIRTRDEEVLKKLDFVYDISLGEFDHHQLDKEIRENNIPYAASGLVWREFGSRVIQKFNSEFDEDDIISIFDYIDKTLVQGIDAIDNGIDSKSEFKVTSISDIIQNFNPTWDDDSSKDDAFEEAVGFAIVVIKRIISRQVSVIKARDIVNKGFENREVNEIMVLKNGCPWLQQLFKIDINSEVLFVISPGDNNAEYKIQTVKKTSGTFEARKDLVESIRGKSSEEINSIIKIDDAIFCHKAGFIASTKSLTSALKIAKLSI
ncbi:MYG1 family protein [Clostridium estertheticum]|uniref:Metal-dependent hydrolase n=3 Tax=Clostridium estertheticum TaxID=238834 RepID=A0A1J0GHU1_9CLOT|nr:MYG1 family protein [Clostridium estertheticum]APC40883.1 metal-dependent hydrolase [Clostridium estertheticum subsp. estertheticum]MBU3073937.1 MYG1 family protein [Clostridium estertheticum]MBU3164031.1 MYG1 family protein [Clostridium estertheticum]MBU3169968.1 MYG1 family protein [Clostridium estertheticum]MBZ9617256.1 MYG1 family protein [Clostridium estertheticum subsp. laramiense]